MAKPPASGPHSDIAGVYRDARTEVPHRNPKKGSAADLEQARRQSKGRPDELKRAD